MVAGTVSASAATGATVPITITPDTGLTNGQAVTITGTGFSDTSIGNVLECNSDSNQPNVHVGGLVNSDISVSCNAPSLSQLVTTTASGTMSATFNVVQGTVGPPCGPAPAVATCPATDAAGNSPTADAALYPCPPTAAQQAIGDVCTLTYGDAGQRQRRRQHPLRGVDSAHDGGADHPRPTPATAPPTTKAPVTAAPPPSLRAPASRRPPPRPRRSATSPSTLAATGPGPGVGWLGAIGIVLLLLGLVLLLVLFEGPRRALAGIVAPGRIRKLSLPVHRHPEGSAPRQMAETATKLVGHVDHLGTPARRAGPGRAGGDARAHPSGGVGVGSHRRLALGSVAHRPDAGRGESRRHPGLGPAKSIPIKPIDLIGFNP